jgi:hypothetical protein
MAVTTYKVGPLVTGSTRLEVGHKLNISGVSFLNMLACGIRDRVGPQTLVGQASKALRVRL